MRIRFVVVLSLAALLAAPAAASAATKSVTMGLPPKQAKKIQDKFGSDANKFYRGTVTIHTGDSVKFLPFGFHTVDFPKTGGKAKPLIVPGGTATGVKDEAGADFWFNGRPTLGLNPALLKSGFGKTFTYTGAKAVNSGLPLQNKPKPMRVKFPNTGTFKYFCDVHPGMKGKVRVKRGGARIPSKRADAAAVAEQIDKDKKAAKKLKNTPVPDDTVFLGSSNGKGVEYFGMLPESLTVPVGTTVSFRMKPKSSEVHTGSFGPGDPEKEPNSYLGKLAKSFESPSFDPIATYSSEPPGTTATLIPTLHGNGFWNTGVLDADAGSPLAVSEEVTFGQAGSYSYVCLIHPFMKGTVIVQ